MSSSERIHWMRKQSSWILYSNFCEHITNTHCRNNIFENLCMMTFNRDFNGFAVPILFFNRYLINNKLKLLWKTKNPFHTGFSWKLEYHILSVLCFFILFKCMRFNLTIPGMNKFLFEYMKGSVYEYSVFCLFCLFNEFTFYFRQSWVFYRHNKKRKRLIFSEQKL